MADIIPIHKYTENFNTAVKNLSDLCKEDLHSINTLILDKLDSSVPLIQEIGKLDKDKSYYIYCRTGVRSANSCHLMEELGFVNTYNLIGGIVDWNGEIIS